MAFSMLAFTPRAVPPNTSHQVIGKAFLLGEHSGYGYNDVFWSLVSAYVAGDPMGAF